MANVVALPPARDPVFALAPELRDERDTAMTETTEGRQRKRRRTEGLIDLFGHTYIPDQEDPEHQVIQNQFQIIRRMRGDRYVVQLFSWLDGGPTEVVVMTEAELLGPNVKLYATEENWHTASEKAHERRRYRREARRSQ